MTNILITGGCGFIGTLLSKSLLDLGHSVISIDPLEPQIHGPKDADYIHISHPQYLHIRDRLENIAQYSTDLSNIRVVYHLASETGTNQSMFDSSKHLQTNCLATSILCDFLINNVSSLERIVLASSRAVYGEGSGICPTHGRVLLNPRSQSSLALSDFSAKCSICNSPCTADASLESDLPNPVSVYGVSKLYQEHHFRVASLQLNIPYHIFRFQNVYGFGQSLLNPYTGMIPIFLSLLSQSYPLNIFEDGDMIRDFVSVSDCVYLLSSVLSQPASFVLNVGTGKPHRILDLAHLLKDILNSTSDILVSGDYRSGDIRSNFSDLTSLYSFFPDYKPTSLEFGLSEYTRQLFADENLTKELMQMSDRFSRSLALSSSKGAFHQSNS